MTAATYAEGTVLYPEAGGSSSFARHAFNEVDQLRRRLGPDARLHRHGGDVGVLRAALPLDLLGAAEDESVGHRRRRRRDRDPRHAQHRRRPGGGEALDRARGARLRDAGAPRAARHVPRVQPHDPRRQHPLGRRADLVEPRARGAGRDARLHRGGDRLQPGRGGARAGAERARRLQARRGSGVRDLPDAAARGAVGAAREDDRRPADDAARAAPGAGRLRQRPDPRARAEPRALGRGAPRARDLRRRPRRDDPVHRHERGRDRGLARHVLDGELPPDPRGVPAPPSDVQDAGAVARPLRRDPAGADHPPRRRQLRRHALLVRGDALVHGRPRVARCGCG